MNFLSKAWNEIVRIAKIINVAGISVTAVLLLWIMLFNVGQVTDAIIALGEFGKIHHFVILVLVGSLWAFFVWYWARVFYYIEYQKQTNLKDYEKVIVKYTPRVLGALALLIIAGAFLKQSPKCDVSSSINPLCAIGITFIILAVIFVIIVNLRRRIFKLTPVNQMHEVLKPEKRIVPLRNLPVHTRRTLIITTIISSIILLVITIFPIHFTIYLGDGVTILITCFCIWLPILYWIRYYSVKLGFPLYLLLAVLIIFFSFFNSNKDIRFVEDSTTDNTKSIGAYTEEWLLKNKTSDNSKKIPMFIVLSEGGGIRAAYWSAQFLARTQRDCPEFRNHLYCISGVSGGSFGATVFDGLLNYYDLHKDEAATPLKAGKNDMQNKITDIIGKDYLSPTIACLCTREVLQLLIPFPIQSFDCAKVFEKTWEYTWKNNLNDDLTFSEPLLSLLDNDSIPSLFINSTQVENGYPVVLSNIRINEGLSSADNQNNFHLPREFYTDILGKASNDVPLSTASLLSARFPYVSPAGTLKDRNNSVISLVDGGYFDNTGANTAYQVLFNIKKIYEKKKKSIYRTDIMPVIIYLKNGVSLPDSVSTRKTLIDQLVAPIETSLQIRDSNTKNNLEKLREFVNYYEGEFITYTLPKTGATETDIPLGWALSRSVQQEIDERVEEIDINAIAKHLN